MMYTATERWFWTADRREVVRESDPRAAFLYAGVGSMVPMDDAIRYGIADRIADAITDAVVEVATDAVDAVIDAVADALNMNDDTAPDDTASDDASSVPDAPVSDDEATDDPPAVETPSQPAVESKPITPKQTGDRRRRR